MAIKALGGGLGRRTDVDSRPSRKMKGVKTKGVSSPKASAWERISGRGVSDSAETRDVYDEQQLERGELGKVRGKKLPEVGSVIVAVLVLVLVWVTWGMIGAVASGVSNVMGTGDNSQVEELRIARDLGVAPYFRTVEGAGGVPCYVGLSPQGEPVADRCQRKASDIERPAWHIEATSAAMTAAGVSVPAPEVKDTSLAAWMGTGHVSMLRVLVALGLAVGAWLGSREWMMRKLDAQNVMHDTADINQYKDDQHIAVPEETMRRYSLFPDAGAHSPVAPSSLMGHAMLSARGTRKVKMLRRHQADVLSEDGEIEFYKNDVVRGPDGQPLYDMVPMIDEDFGQMLFTTSGLAEDRRLRKFFNPEAVDYNPGGADRDKTGKQDTVAAHINEDWDLPEYEPQRPAGVYMVDEAPVNTMVLAMTRAGKGQTYIEPMIDMWLREAKPNNMVVNDPKGELLVKNYVRATRRGYQVIQFNLINALKTDIYNPLGMAAEAAREGNSTKCALYVENIAEVFFPVDGADDPVWPNAANNAFKRTAYGMIDFYLEEERQMRKRAVVEGWDLKVLETRLDESWGKVTLYNAYQLFVQLSSKKLKDPVSRLTEEVKAGLHGDVENDSVAAEAFNALVDLAQEQMPLWDGEEELDMLTLFFNASKALPANSMRTLVANSDNALRSMGAAEKMLASVYGIAITAMSFFVDPTISTLTSGTLSQNVDLGGMSFPRRFGVRFDQNYVRRYNLVGTQVKWECFTDAGFTQAMGPKFEHEDTVSREGWAWAYLEGIFPEDVTYLRLRLFNIGSGTPFRTFHFKFTKAYQTNLKGRAYIKDPVLGEKIVKNGLLVELEAGEDGVFRQGSTVFSTESLNVDQLSLEEINSGDNDLIKKIASERNAVLSTQVRYAEKPKVVFLVTPPHLMKYAKLILILLKQLVDLNFDSSYMSKSNQKPLYKTRFMLDELGNLQSEGHGIAGFETMLSIGLGQEQQFTLILQTLQQLKDVYGDSVDKIVQGNAQPLTSKIATPTGWSTMGQMAPGTQVLTPDGELTEVTGVYPQGERPVFQVTRADGSTTEACDEHLWEIEIEVDADDEEFV